MLENFRADLKHYFGDRPRTLHALFCAFFEMSLWAIAIFRFGKWAQRVRFPLLRPVLLLIYFFLYKTAEGVTGIRISSESDIGPGLLIHNFGGIVIRGRVGRGCIIVQGAQLLSRADAKGEGWPTLGDHVFVGAGAKIIGDVRVGHHVQIGANAVVRTDVPDHAVVLPPECRIVPRELSTAPAPPETVSR